MSEALITGREAHKSERPINRINLRPRAKRLIQLPTSGGSFIGRERWKTTFIFAKVDTCHRDLVSLVVGKNFRNFKKEVAGGN